MPYKKTLLGLVLVLLGGSQAWLSHLRLGVAQKTGELRAESRILNQEVQNLRLELASLNRPDTLRRLAREKLGMQAPEPAQVVQQ